MFRFKWIADRKERTYGFAWRFLGADISVLFIGWLNEWSIIDIRIPCNYGAYIQVAFMVLSIGRLADDSVYKDTSE